MWQGFITESKKFMNHPDYWPECNAHPYKPDGWTIASKRKAAFKFWIAFPKAAMKFYFYTACDWLRNFIYR
jgi:L-rhamnose isomerase